MMKYCYSYIQAVSVWQALNWQSFFTKPQVKILENFEN